MQSIEWAMWANEHAIVSISCMFMGGVIGVTGYFHHYGIAVYALILAVLLLILEYPRSKRRKGKTSKRIFQYIPAKLVNRGGTFTQNYYWRFVVHLLCSVPLLFHIPLIIAGLCELITSAIYFSAGYHGERWIPMTSENYEQPASQSENREVQSCAQTDQSASVQSRGEQATNGARPRRAAPTPYENVPHRTLTAVDTYENVPHRAQSEQTVDEQTAENEHHYENLPARSK